MKKALFFITILFISINSFGQHENQSHNNSNVHGTHTSKHGKNLIAISYGYDHVRGGVAHDAYNDESENEDKEGHWVSSIGLDYFRRISEKWEVGLKLDFQLGHYIIPHKDNLERENAFVVVATGVYELMPKWSAFAGAGMEFEKSEHLPVLRLGTEYGFHLQHGWVLPVGFFWDIKDGYNVYAFTVGIGKHF